MLPMSQFRTQSQPRQSKLYLVKIKLATGMVGIDMMAMMSKKFLFKIVEMDILGMIAMKAIMAMLAIMVMVAMLAICWQQWWQKQSADAALGRIWLFPNIHRSISTALGFRFVLPEK